MIAIHHHHHHNRYRTSSPLRYLKTIQCTQNGSIGPFINTLLITRLICPRCQHSQSFSRHVVDGM